MRTSAVSRMWTSRKKKIATPVMRCRTQDHIPSCPRYTVPAGAFGSDSRGEVRVGESLGAGLVDTMRYNRLLEPERIRSYVRRSVLPTPNGGAPRIRLAPPFRRTPGRLRPGNPGRCGPRSLQWRA